MCENHSQPTPAIYEIRLSGRLSPELAAWLVNLTGAVIQEAPGITTTLLSVPIPDQAALFGVLARIRDLGLNLISVNRLEQRVEFEYFQDQE
jgi:hypothetical protein